MEQMFGTTVRMPGNAARITPTGAEEDYENYHPRLSCLFLRQYKYPRCISPGTLRILKLPPANLKQEVINCELIESQTVGSDDTQEYEALSWCWGVEKEHMKAFASNTLCSICVLVGYLHLAMGRWRQQLSGLGVCQVQDSE